MYMHMHGRPHGHMTAGRTALMFRLNLSGVAAALRRLCGGCAVALRRRANTSPRVCLCGGGGSWACAPLHCSRKNAYVHTAGLRWRSLGSRESRMIWSWKFEIDPVCLNTRNCACAQVSVNSAVHVATCALSLLQVHCQSSAIPPTPPSPPTMQHDTGSVMGCDESMYFQQL